MSAHTFPLCTIFLTSGKWFHQWEIIRWKSITRIYWTDKQDLLNLTGDYNLRHLATDVRHYFENSPSSLEVLIFKGNKKISITRNIAESSGFLKMLLKAFR